MLNTKHTILNNEGVMLVSFPELTDEVAACFTTRMGGVSKGNNDKTMIKVKIMIKRIRDNRRSILQS